jgi:hypothetical protein
MLLSRRGLLSVIQAQSVELARTNAMPLETNWSHTEKTGTVIRADDFVLAGSIFDPYNLSKIADQDDCTTELQDVIDRCFHVRTGAAPKPLIIPPGRFTISSPLRLTGVMGARIVGAGRFSTTITNKSGGSVFRTNGLSYSHLEGLCLSSEGRTSPIFDLDWDGKGAVSLQSNTFVDMYFDRGSVGVSIGGSDYMGSENLFLNCFFSENHIAGLCTRNFNALQQTIIGGNFQACGVGVLVAAGSVPVISGVGFQLSKVCDIRIENVAHDTYLVSGCRSESTNFLSSYQGTSQVHISSCSHIASSELGKFCEANGNIILDNCFSLRGVIAGGPTSTLWTRGCVFGRSDFLDPQIFKGRIVQSQTNGFLSVSSSESIIATPDGTQASAVMLNTTINRIVTASSDHDAVKLPYGSPGSIVFVTNSAEKTVNVFPNYHHSIGQLTVNSAYPLPKGKTVIFTCASEGRWSTLVGA